MPRTSVKGQALADFVAEFTESPLEELKPAENIDKKLVGTISQHDFSPWEVYVDRASNQKGSGVGLVLIRVNYGVQWPVYYVSKSLHETEVRYLPLEKAILAVVLGTHKLPHYFQAHTVVVLT